MTDINPLQQYFRTIKLYTVLPSGIKYYIEDDVVFNSSGELGVMAMTAKDDAIIKNPDALLNGEAISQIILSCVPGVKNPKALLSNDIDALLVAIRQATYGERLDIDADCPECNHSGEYSANLANLLTSMNKLEDEYSIGLPNDLSIYVRPFSYADSLTALKAQFEQHKLIKTISDKNLTEEQRMHMFSKSFDSITELNASLLTECVTKIVHKEGLVVESKEHISQFLHNVSKDVFTSIDELVKDINSIGINKKFKVTCTECNHSWEADINFDPVGFFTAS